MKSARHAARIAFFCSAVGLCGALAGGEIGAVACAGSDFLGCVVICSLCSVSAGGLPDSDATAARHDGESPAALAFRQSITSGLLGEIHEQCAIKSSSVHACLIVLI